MDPGREVVTEGGPLQESVGANAPNLEDDPVFSAGGDVAFNWNNNDNGHRLVMTGGILTNTSTESTDVTRGFGNDFFCNPKTGISFGRRKCAHEISNQVQSGAYWQGSDNSNEESYLQKGPVYGQYAIYVSKDADHFPFPGYQLGLKVDVHPLNTLPEYFEENGDLHEII